MYHPVRSYVATARSQSNGVQRAQPATYILCTLSWVCVAKTCRFQILGLFALTTAYFVYVSWVRVGKVCHSVIS
jgi:hypothetical protein